MLAIPYMIFSEIDMDIPFKFLEWHGMKLYILLLSCKNGLKKQYRLIIYLMKNVNVSCLHSIQNYYLIRWIFGYKQTKRWERRKIHKSHVKEISWFKFSIPKSKYSFQKIKIQDQHFQCIQAPFNIIIHTWCKGTYVYA